MKYLIILVALTAFLEANAFPQTKFVNDKFTIIGGDEAKIEDFPWSISLEFWGIHNCGGSIISNDTILTAAHCLSELFVPFYIVVAGTSSLSLNGTRIGIKETIIHEDYNIYDNDIGIIKLTEPLEFSDQIQPVALPEQDEEIVVGTAVNISGWGRTQENNLTLPLVLRSVEVNTIDLDVCLKDYSEYDDIITDSMICTAVDGGGKNACMGDSGGPLTKDGKLFGIISFSLGCGEPNYPGVHTNVGRYRNWIKEKTGI